MERSHLNKIAHLFKCRGVSTLDKCLSLPDGRTAVGMIPSVEDGLTPHIVIYIYKYKRIKDIYINTIYTYIYIRYFFFCQVLSICS